MRKIGKRGVAAVMAALLLTVSLILVGIYSIPAVSAEEAVQESAPQEEASTQGVPFWEKYTPEEWEAFLKTTVVPYAAAAISAMGLLYVMISPILSKITKASGNFEDSAKRVQDSASLAEQVTKICQGLTNDNAARYASMVAAVEGAIEQMQQGMADELLKLHALEARMQAQFDTVQADFEKIYEREGDILLIEKLGFGERTELVKKGVAAEIQKIGEGSGNDATHSQE